MTGRDRAGKADGAADEPDDVTPAADATDDASVEKTDDRTDAKAEDTTDETVADATPAAAPKPRPTTAASRARRIGGGTVPTPVRAASPDATPAVGADDEPTVRLGKRAKLDKAGDRTGDKADAKPVGKAGSKAAATPVKDESDRTLAVPAWAAWVPAVAFVAVAAVFLALLLVNRLGGDDETSGTSTKQRQTVLAAAKNCVAATNTYRYVDIPKFQAAGVACTTGVYTGQYSNAMNTLIKPNAATQQFNQIAKVTSAGIESVSSNGKQWTVLVFGQLNITTKALPKGRIDPFYLVATMSQAKGKWVIARISLLSSAS